MSIFMPILMESTFHVIRIATGSAIFIKKICIIVCILVTFFPIYLFRGSGRLLQECPHHIHTNTPGSLIY